MSFWGKLQLALDMGFSLSDSYILAQEGATIRDLSENITIIQAAYKRMMDHNFNNMREFKQKIDWVLPVLDIYAKTKHDINDHSWHWSFFNRNNTTPYEAFRSYLRSRAYANDIRAVRILLNTRQENGNFLWEDGETFLPVGGAIYYRNPEIIELICQAKKHKAGGSLIRLEKKPEGCGPFAYNSIALSSFSGGTSYRKRNKKFYHLLAHVIKGKTFSAQIKASMLLEIQMVIGGFSDYLDDIFEYAGEFPDLMRLLPHEVISKYHDQNYTKEKILLFLKHPAILADPLAVDNLLNIKLNNEYVFSDEEKKKLVTPVEIASSTEKKIYQHPGNPFTNNNIQTKPNESKSIELIEISTFKKTLTD